MASRPPDDRFDPAPPTAQERQRFIVLNVVRLTGVALVLVGILVLNGVIDLPAVAGWTFIPVGLVEVFVAPLVLARQWRTPKP